VGVVVGAGMAPWDGGQRAKDLVVAGALESNEGAVAVAAGKER